MARIYNIELQENLLTGSRLTASIRIYNIELQDD